MATADEHGLIGQTLAQRYRVNAKLGEGGMGTVYKATDLKLSCEVVIKTPHAALMKDAEFAARFRREIRSLVQLSHAHIVNVMDVDVHDGVPFAVMQHLPGGSLEDRQQPCAPNEILGWLGDIADALDFMHQRGLIHRDIKPANILLDESGRAYLGDFGIAKVVAAGDESDQKGLTGTGTMIGTGEFMAPEMLMPDLYSDKYNERVDQYALAVTVYEMLAGRPPFRGDTIATVAVKMARTKAPLLHELNPEISERLSQAVARGLSRKPDRRHPDCRAFAEAVSIAITSGTGQTTVFGVRASTGQERPTSPETKPPKERRVTSAARTIKDQLPSRRRTMVADEPADLHESPAFGSDSQTAAKRPTSPLAKWLRSPAGILSSVGGIICLLVAVVAYSFMGGSGKEPTNDPVETSRESEPLKKSVSDVVISSPNEPSEDDGVQEADKINGLISPESTVVKPVENPPPAKPAVVVTEPSQPDSFELPVVAPVPHLSADIARTQRAEIEAIIKADIADGKFGSPPSVVRIKKFVKEEIVRRKSAGDLPQRTNITFVFDKSGGVIGGGVTVATGGGKTENKNGTEEDGSKIKPNYRWTVFFPARSAPPQGDALKFKARGGDVNRIGNYQAIGKWSVQNGGLTSHTNQPSAIRVAKLDNFELEGNMSAGKTGGWFILIGHNSPKPFLLYHIALRTTVNWALSTWEDDRPVGVRSLPNPRWSGTQPFKLVVVGGKMTFVFGKSVVANNVSLPDYVGGDIFIGNYNTQYGPMALTIRSLRYRSLREKKSKVLSPKQ